MNAAPTWNPLANVPANVSAPFGRRFPRALVLESTFCGTFDGLDEDDLQYELEGRGWSKERAEALAGWLPGLRQRVLKDMGLPRYQHDCPKCQFLGHFEMYDLYICGEGDLRSITTRYGNRDSQNTSAGIDTLRCSERDCWNERYFHAAVLAKITL